jgi:hypothetical protein
MLETEAHSSIIMGVEKRQSLKKIEMVSKGLLKKFPKAVYCTETLVSTTRKQRR